uniref:ArsR family transcriptional regulator n=1 Tax=Candidatus Methanomethylicus mesodigestus TaxID=1867258 RepID=A0A7C3J4V5_9CREN
MKPINDESNKTRIEIEKKLATAYNKEGATINQIAKDLSFSWITVKKHLDYLEAIGRVEVRKFGNSQVYFLNGQQKWSKKISLSPFHTLYLDTFISPFNEPYLRIKETKMMQGKWKVIGNVMITKDRLCEVIDFLTELKDKIGQYQQNGNPGGES